LIISCVFRLTPLNQLILDLEAYDNFVFTFTDFFGIYKESEYFERRVLERVLMDEESVSTETEPLSAKQPVKAIEHRMEPKDQKAVASGQAVPTVSSQLVTCKKCNTEIPPGTPFYKQNNQPKCEDCCIADGVRTTPQVSSKPVQCKTCKLAIPPNTPFYEVNHAPKCKNCCMKDGIDSAPQTSSKPVSTLQNVQQTDTAWITLLRGQSCTKMQGLLHCALLFL
ncbi:hypothetical protein COOONC_18004, partial [Cooperia oncophora]